MYTCMYSHILVSSYSMYPWIFVSMYPCIMHPCIHVFMHPGILLFIYPCIHVFTYPCIHISLYPHIPCILVSLYPCIHVSCIHVFMYSCILVSFCSYIHVFMYSHILVSWYSHIHVSSYFMYPCIHAFMYSCILIPLYSCLLMLLNVWHTCWVSKLVAATSPPITYVTTFTANTLQCFPPSVPPEGWWHPQSLMCCEAVCFLTLCPLLSSSDVSVFQIWVEWLQDWLNYSYLLDLSSEVLSKITHQTRNSNPLSFVQVDPCLEAICLRAFIKCTKVIEYSKLSVTVSPSNTLLQLSARIDNLLQMALASNKECHLCLESLHLIWYKPEVEWIVRGISLFLSIEIRFPEEDKQAKEEMKQLPHAVLQVLTFLGSCNEVQIIPWDVSFPKELEEEASIIPSPSFASPSSYLEGFSEYILSPELEGRFSTFPFTSLPSLPSDYGIFQEDLSEYMPCLQQVMNRWWTESRNCTSSQDYLESSYYNARLCNHSFWFLLPHNFFITLSCLLTFLVSGRQRLVTNDAEWQCWMAVKS